MYLAVNQSISQSVICPPYFFLSHISHLLAVNENPINPLLSDPAFSISFAQFIMYMYMYIRQGQATLEAPPQS